MTINKKLAESSVEENTESEKMEILDSVYED